MSETKYEQATGTQGELLVKLRKFYRQYLKLSLVDKVIKALVNWVVDIYAVSQGFYFPKKYFWDWKMEMLLYRFEKETVRAFKDVIRPGMTALDIGGHIGYYTRFFSKLVGSQGHVYTFEPVKDNFLLLSKNTKNLKNVVLNNKAVGDKNGTVSFYQTFSNTGSHSLLEVGVKAQKIEVDCVTLDSFVEENNIKDVNVIKIDVEGAEPLVLKGAENLISRSKELYIIMELIHDNLDKLGYNPSSYFKYLQGLGLDIYFILPDGSTKTFDVDHYNWEELAKGKVYINLLLKKNNK